MKKVIFLSLAISLIIGSCAQEEKSPTEGTWQMVYHSNGETTYPGQITGSGIKMWTKDCFAFVGKFQIDTVMLDNFGWGKYKFIEGNKYEENIILHNTAPSSEGQTLKMLMEVRNDTLIQRWSVDENWNLQENYNIEKYVRVK